MPESLTCAVCGIERDKRPDWFTKPFEQFAVCPDCMAVLDGMAIGFSELFRLALARGGADREVAVQLISEERQKNHD